MDINKLNNAYNQYVKNETLKKDTKIGKTSKEDRIIKQEDTPVKVSVDGSSKKYIEMARNEIPEVRESLVEELRQAIEQGLYKIDPDKIAERMLGGF